MLLTFRLVGFRTITSPPIGLRMIALRLERPIDHFVEIVLQIGENGVLPVLGQLPIRYRLVECAFCVRNDRALQFISALAMFLSDLRQALATSEFFHQISRLHTQEACHRV